MALLIRDRIRELRRVPASQLAPNPKNWRTHPSAQLDALRGVLAEVGYAGAALARELPDGTLQLIDGHARAEISGDGAVPILVLDVTAEEADKILATFDPLSAMADAAKLDDLLRQVRTESDALRAMMDGLATAHDLPAGAAEPGAGGDEFDPTPEERGPTRTAPGELWSIGGRHRLLVGDCTDAATVARLLGDERVEMVWTDPPYGVSIGDKNALLNRLDGRGSSNRVTSNLRNDSLDEPGLSAMLEAAFARAASHCEPGASWYVAAPAGPLHLLFGRALNDLGIWRQTIQWVKNSATFSPMGVSYHWKSEPIFYGWLPDAGHRYHGDRKQTTVWEFDRPSASADHPTMKPVALVAQAIEHASLAGQLVYDPFLGSGTTLVAAHRLGRRCSGCEIEPRYADVILKRAEAEGLDCVRREPGTPEAEVAKSEPSGSKPSKTRKGR